MDRIFSCAAKFATLTVLLAGSALEAFPKTKLTAPGLDESLLTNASVYLHDYRSKGIRVEPSYVEQKFILHNYGHGGASLQLAWGSAYEAFEFLQIAVLSDQFPLFWEPALSAYLQRIFWRTEDIKCVSTPINLPRV
jgi:hypothetical protein